MSNETAEKPEGYELKEFSLIPKYLSQTRLVLFNGPPRSGKDTAQQIAEKYVLRNAETNGGDVPDIYHVKLSRPVKEAAHRFFNLDAAHDAFEDVKDVPHRDFLNVTPRAAYIKISEGFAKPLLGKDIWSMLAWKQISAQIHGRGGRPSVVIYSDIGFQEEMEYLKNIFPPQFMALARLNRPETSFVGDSRQFIFGNMGGEMWEKSIDNNRSLFVFEEKIENFLAGFFRTDQAAFFRNLVGTE